MKLSEFKRHLATVQDFQIFEPNGQPVPSHFHLTEMGLVQKHFIDCGGMERREQLVSFQLWVATDTDHRLLPQKVLKIIDMGERLLPREDLDVEVEYQGVTVGRFEIDFKNGHFLLLPKQTACLALDTCGVNLPKKRIKLSALNQEGLSCTPDSGCC